MFLYQDNSNYQSFVNSFKTIVKKAGDILSVVPGRNSIFQVTLHCFYRQKQPFADVFQNMCSWKFRNVHTWKTPVPDGLQLYSKETPTQLFFCEYHKIFKNSFLYGTFPVLLLNSFFANYQFLYPLENVKKPLVFWKFKGVYKWNTGVKCFNVLNEVYIEKRTNEVDQNIRLTSVSYETLVDLGFHLFETSVNITYGLCSKSTSNIETFLLNVPFWYPDVFKGIRREHWKEMG